MKRIRIRFAALPIFGLLLYATAGAAFAHPDHTRLPLGDGQYSTTAPAVGTLYLCSNSVRSQADTISAPWMNGDGTYDSTKIVKVDGSVDWDSQLSITLSGANRVITGNDLPNHPTGTYPISKSDDAASYDKNPNSISAQTIMGTLPANPTLAATPSCTPGGAIGVMLSGAVIFNGLDSEGRDAVANEITDGCNGHPQQQGWYHYHNLSPCLTDTTEGHSDLVGYALDGFGIYGTRGEDGQELSTSDLDECHGHTHTISWDGVDVEMFHYHATAEYPYTVGCYRGSKTIRLESNTGTGTQCTTGNTQSQGGQGTTQNQGGQGQGQQGGQRGQTQPRLPSQQQGGQQQGGQGQGSGGQGQQGGQSGSGGQGQQGGQSSTCQSSGGQSSGGQSQTGGQNQSGGQSGQQGGEGVGPGGQQGQGGSGGSSGSGGQPGGSGGGQGQPSGSGGGQQPSGGQGQPGGGGQQPGGGGGGRPGGQGQPSGGGGQRP